MQRGVQKHGHALRAEGTPARGRRQLGGPAGSGRHDGGGGFREEVLLELSLEGEDEQD